MRRSHPGGNGRLRQAEPLAAPHQGVEHLARVSANASKPGNLDADISNTVSHREIALGQVGCL